MRSFAGLLWRRFGSGRGAEEKGVSAHWKNPFGNITDHRNPLAGPFCLTAQTLHQRNHISGFWRTKHYNRWQIDSVTTGFWTVYLRRSTN